MNKIVEGLLVFVGVVFLLMGAIFLIAGGLDNIAVGAVLILISFVLFFIVYRTEKIEAAKPKLISQTFNVKVDGSGQFNAKEMKCKSCGAPIADKDLKVIQGGIMATCPYCSAVFAMEEAPKW